MRHGLRTHRNSGMVAAVGMIALFTALAGEKRAYACGGYGVNWGREAIVGDAKSSGEAVAALRAMGPAGLTQLLAEAERGRFDQKQVTRAVNAVAGQHDAMRSKLYWHADLAKALEQAQVENKPVLSLRLLGRLDEEMSCANSRFFRTVLYPNPQVSEYLRGNYVLHWQSVRPAPVITIDFGDGRMLKRTITGNSIHYVLDSRGRMVDAIPGLMSAPVFMQLLKDAEALAERTAGEEDPGSIVRLFHAEKAHADRVLWGNDLKQTGLIAANVEVASLTNGDLERLSSADPETWGRMASLHVKEWRLDAETRRRLAGRTPSAFDAGRLAVGKAIVEDPMLRMVGRFERSMAEDTVRNRYQLRGTLHEWFAEGWKLDAVDAFNERVYEVLFKMPPSDPWLGLMSDFDGLERLAAQ